MYYKCLSFGFLHPVHFSSSLVERSKRLASTSNFPTDAKVSFLNLRPLGASSPLADL